MGKRTCEQMKSCAPGITGCGGEKHVFSIILKMQPIYATV